MRCGVGRAHVNQPFTELAEVQVPLFGNLFCDVHLCPQAAHTHVGRVGLNGGPTLTTQTGQQNTSRAITRWGGKQGAIELHCPSLYSPH